MKNTIDLGERLMVMDEHTRIRGFFYSAIFCFLASCAGSNSSNLYAYTSGSICESPDKLNSAQRSSCRKKQELEEAVNCDCEANTRYNAALKLARLYEKAGYDAQYLIHLSMAAIATQESGDYDLALELLREFFTELKVRDSWMGKFSLMAGNSILAGEIYEATNVPGKSFEHYCFALFIIEQAESKFVISPTNYKQLLNEKRVTNETCRENFEKFAKLGEEF